MKTRPVPALLILLAVGISRCVVDAGAAPIILDVGVQSQISWPTTWAGVTGFGDEPGSATHQFEFDLVGTGTGPRYMASWACSPAYVFFQIRIDKPTTAWTGTAGTVFVFIDNSSASSGNNIPDWGFAWDARDNATALANHGLEMQQIDIIGANNKWSLTEMKDRDGTVASKGTTDINGGSRADGYVHAYSTTDYDTNGDSLINIAVSWNYLSAYTGLAQNQDWRIAIGARADGADHDPITWDIGGLVGSTADTNSLIQDTAWSNTLHTVPEPSALVLALGGAAAAAGLRRRHRKTGDR